MTKNEKLALADLLRSWRHAFNNNWVTAEQVIEYVDYLRGIGDGDLLCQLGIASGDGHGLNRRLDEVRDTLIYNFVVKREVPNMQPAKWSVFLQDYLVEITDEEQCDRLERRREAGLQIDPETAEVCQSWGNGFDPYGFFRSDYYLFEKLYWARSPGSDIWVEFEDLPGETRKLLSKVVKETYGSRLER